MSKELEAFNEIIDKFAEQMMRANKEELTAINKTNAIEYLYRTPQVRLLQQGLQRLEAIDNANPSEALECLEYLGDFKLDVDILLCNTKAFPKIKQALIKAQEQEKENELLKEIIKSFFDRGCPLHQYTDKEGILTIEVDDECSIMHLGEFRGVDLDKKLKEVLE